MGRQTEFSPRASNAVSDSLQMLSRLLGWKDALHGFIGLSIITGQESQGGCSKEKLQYSYIYLLPLQEGFIFHSWKGNHLSQLLMSESSLETQACWKAHDTVYICSYVPI